MILAYPAQFTVHYDVRDPEDKEVFRGDYITRERKILHIDLAEILKIVAEREFPNKIVAVHGIHPYDGSPLTPHGLTHEIRSSS